MEIKKSATGANTHNVDIDVDRINSSRIYEAPSNIALIKYMGKTESDNNLPTNSSISYTLNHLKSFVRITRIDGDKDQWRPLDKVGCERLQLSEKSIEKFLKHFLYLKNKFQVASNFLIESANNFPSDCGIASSSSSFAALTLGAVHEFQELTKEKLDLSVSHLSFLSRKGSGSSCRSFFSPWCLWKNDRGESLDLPIENLHHVVLLIDTTKKEVSSSEAHRRVPTSPYFKERLQKIDLRIENLILAFRQRNWGKVIECCWEEFEEMHRLFETSVPPFTYRSEMTLKILNKIQKMSLERSPSRFLGKPIVTMDAGNNIHFLFLPEHLDSAKKLINEFSQFKVITSWGH